ncbi:MAG: gliding motility protein GldM [Candidatus Azobacteroides sp.]|nr:gliding motility protein GldM [Candidatus Azobacteroides sp.]
MYLVFIGMLALNVSTEVLDGFELVEESLLRSVKSTTQRNERIFDDLNSYYKANEEKTRVWYEKGKQVKDRTDSLYNYAQDLKNRIVIKSDGKDGDPEQLKHPDDLNAAYEVMFERKKNDGARLKSQIDSYREYVATLVTNPSIKNIIENNLSTEPSAKAKENKQTWEESMFWQMPVAAAVTLLTKIQNDIRYAEGAVLSDLLNNVDLTDYRVNKVSAFVIPQSQTVISGGSYQADIVLSAQDSTQRPKIFVNDKYLPAEANGRYVVNAGSTGTFPVKGYIEMPQGDGSSRQYTFSTEYFVQEPSATVAPVLMNVLYAGIDNDIRIAVPGITGQNVMATMTNGSLTPKGNGIWVARPAKAGTEAIITVSAKMPDGRIQEMAKPNFRVRVLPDPKPYLTIEGKALPFDGGPLSKAELVGVNVAEAAIDDGILKMPFTVLRFEVSTTNDMGLTIRELSDGARFSDRQKALIRSLVRGKTVLIRGMVARGPDGSERTLKSPLEIIIN